MPEPVTEEQLQERLERLESGEPQPNGKQYQYITPFEQTADSLLAVLQNTQDRFMLGLPEIDTRTRGFGQKELVLVVGFAHAGKTQLVNTMIVNNLDKRILFFSLDDPSEMILTKLVCMRSGTSADELENYVRNEPEEARKWLRHEAKQTFGNLLVPDGNFGLATMDHAIAEASDYWGAAPQAIVIDYLQLIPSDDADYEDTKKKSQAIKRWIKGVEAPVIVLHQSNRSKGGPGEVISMLSAAYGGEQEGTFMLGVRRKLFDESVDAFERERMHRDTVTLHLVKNKRPPGRLTPPDGIDFTMDPETGLIRPRTNADLDKGGASMVASRIEQQRIGGT